MHIVMQTIRNYGRGNPLAPAVPSDLSLIVNEDAYEGRIRQLLAEEKFDELEKSARSVRADKSRAVGGVWLLFCFYESRESQRQVTTRRSRIGRYI